MKKITSLVFMALCLCFFTGTAKAQTVADWSEDGIWYKVIDADKVAVCQDTAGQNYTGTVIVPAVVTHEGVTYTATAVGNRAFAYEQGAENTVEHVNLPGTIISIGGCAFQYCSGLKDIVIPNSVIALWDDDFDGADDEEGGTFMGCTGLEEITIGSGITDMSAPNGLFNLNGQEWNLKKVTCLASTPPTIAGATAFAVFGGDVSNTVLFVPGESVDAYLTDYWWDFATAEQHEGSSGAGIYPIGTCLPALNLQAENETGLVTWDGDAGAYNIVFSTTELEDPSTGDDVMRIMEKTYDPGRILDEGTTYYVYVQADCGDESQSIWRSASFFFGQLCDAESKEAYTLKAIDTEGYGWSDCNVKIYQNNGNGEMLVATVPDMYTYEEDENGYYGFGMEQEFTVMLCPNMETRLVWTTGYYGDMYTESCGMELKDPAGLVVYSVEAGGLVTVTTDPETGEEIAVPTYETPLFVFGGNTVIDDVKLPKVSVIPTMSRGYINITGAVGSTAGVTDMIGRTVMNLPVTRENQRIDLNLANGIYLVSIRKGNECFVQKVIVRK